GGFFFQAEDGIRAFHVTGVQTCALPIFAQHEEATLDEAEPPHGLLGVVAAGHLDDEVRHPREVVADVLLVEVVGVPAQVRDADRLGPLTDQVSQVEGRGFDDLLFVHDGSKAKGPGLPGPAHCEVWVPYFFRRASVMSLTICSTTS